MYLSNLIDYLTACLDAFGDLPVVLTAEDFTPEGDFVALDQAFDAAGV